MFTMPILTEASHLHLQEIYCMFGPKSLWCPFDVLDGRKQMKVGAWLLERLVRCLGLMFL